MVRLVHAPLRRGAGFLTAVVMLTAMLSVPAAGASVPSVPRRHADATDQPAVVHADATRSLPAGFVTGKPPAYTISELPSLAPSGSTGRSRATSITDSGAIVGFGTDAAADATLRPMSWTPTGVGAETQFVAKQLSPLLAPAPGHPADGGGSTVLGAQAPIDICTATGCGGEPAIAAADVGGPVAPQVQAAGSLFTKGVSRAAAWIGAAGLDGPPSDGVVPYTTDAVDPCDPNPTQGGDRGCAATGIDSDGDVVGFIGGAATSTSEKPFVRLAGSSAYELLDGASAVPAAVARSLAGYTTVVGCATAGGICSGAVTWEGTDQPAHQVGPVGALSATDVNSSEVMVGYGHAPNGGGLASWSGQVISGSYSWLSSPVGFTSTQARSINESDVIVGWATSQDDSSEAVLWEQAAQPIELQSALSLADQLHWTSLLRAYDINSKGDIVGVGIYDGHEVAFVMRVVPVVFVPGIASSTLNSGQGNHDRWLGCNAGTPNAAKLKLTEPLYARDAFRHESCFLGVYNDRLDPSLDGDGTILDTLVANGYREYDARASSAAQAIAKRQACALTPAAEASSLFVFGYDWRQDIATTMTPTGPSGIAHDLALYMACVRKFSHDDGRGITVIAHSMGNLVTRRYQIENPDVGPRANTLTTFISLNPPWWGAAKLLYVGLTGDFIPTLATGPAFRDAIQTMNAPWELAPSSLLVASPQFDGSALHVRAPSGPSIAQSLLQRLDYDGQGHWLDMNVPRVGVHKLGEGFHTSSQDNFSGDSPSTRYVEFYGVQSRAGGGALANTPGPVNYASTMLCRAADETCRSSTGYSYRSIAGDGTVPLDSLTMGPTSAYLAPNTTMYRCQGPPAESPAKNDGIEHTLMLRNTEVVNDVVAALRGKAVHAGAQCALDQTHTTAVAAPTKAGSRSSRPSRNTDGPALWQATASGATSLSVTDAGGSTVSSDPTVFGYVPGVSIAVPDPIIKMATLPDQPAESYTLTFTPSAQDAALRLETDDGTDAWRWQDLAVPADAVATVAISGSVVGPLSYTDDAGPHTVPGEHLTGATASDEAPPSVAICARQQAGSTSYEVQASDVGGTVSDIYTSTDGTHYSPYTSPLTLDPTAAPVLSAFANDSNHNRSGAVAAKLTGLTTNPGFTISDDTVRAGDGSATVTITLPCQSSLVATVHYATHDGTAVAGQNYTATSGSVSIPPGQDSASVKIPVIDNPEATGTLRFTVDLADADGAPITTSSASVSIAYQDPQIPPTISVGDVAVTQPLTGSKVAKVPVTLSRSAAVPVTVSWATQDGTARKGREYVAASGKLTIPAGVPSASVPVQIRGTRAPHKPRTFQVQLSDPSGASLADSAGKVTVTSQATPSAPVLSGTAATGSTGLSWTAPDPGTSPISGFTVYRGTASGAETLLTTLPTDASTYTDSSVTNDTTYYYQVTATNAVGEGARSNEVALRPAVSTVPATPTLQVAAANGVVHLTWQAPSQGGAQIDGYELYRSHETTTAPELVGLSPAARSYDDSTVANGVAYTYQLTAHNSYGTSARSVTVTALPAGVPDAASLTVVPGSSAVHLRWEAPDATGGLPVTGYRVLRGTSPGTETLLDTVVGNAYDDTAVINGTPYYYVVQAVTSAGIGAVSGEGSATPTATAPPALYVADATVTAPGPAGQSALDFSVRLSEPSTRVITAHASTGNRSALPGSDYVPVDTSVSFPAGSVVQTVSVPVIGLGAVGDGRYQGVVTVPLTVDTATGGAVLARDTGVGSIASHLAAPLLTVPDVTVNENAGTMRFTATLSTVSAVDTTVQYATRNGTALAGTNYTATTGALTIPAGSTTGSITVPVVNSNGSGAPRTLQVALYGPVGATTVNDVVGAMIVLTSNGQTACQLATIHWVGSTGSDGQWSTAGNWSPVRVPTGSDIVCVNGGVRSRVDLPVTVAALGTTVPLTVAGKLTLTSTTQSSQLGAGMLLDRTTNAAELDVAGTLDVTAGTLDVGDPAGAVDNSGQANLGGAGTVIVHAGATLQITAGACSYRYSQNTDVPHQGGCTSVTPALRNDGIVTVASGLLQRDSEAPIVNDGTLTLAGPDIGDPTDSALTGSVQGGCVDLTTIGAMECATFPLTNTGLIQRTTGPGTSAIDFADLTNSGTVHGLGSLRLVELHNATVDGLWKVDAGAEFDFDGPATLTLPSTSSLTGAGAVEIGSFPYFTGGIAGHLVVQGTFTPDALNVRSGEIDLPRSLPLHTITLQSGTIAGGGGITVLAAGTASISGGTYAATTGLTVSGSDGISAAATYSGSGGTWASPGPLTWQPGVNATQTATLTMTGGRLVNQGRLTLDNAGINASGGTITNSGTVTTLGGNGLNPVGFFDTNGGQVPFTNLGTVIASSTGPTEIDAYAGGAGSLRVTSSTLVLRSRSGETSQLSGGAAVSSGATLDLSGATSTGPPGAFTLPAGKTFSGSGTLSIGRANSQVDVDIEGTDSLPALSCALGRGHHVTLGTALSLASLSAFAPSGVAGFAGPGSITLPSGATGTLGADFSGAGSFTVAGGATLVWNGGTMDGTGTTTFAEGSTVTMSAAGVAGTRNLVNAGALSVTGGGVQMGGGSFVNSGHITFSGGNDINPVWIRDVGQTSSPFTNNGTIAGVPGGPYGIDGYNGGAGTLSMDTSSMSLTPYTGETVTLPATASIDGTLVLGATPASNLTPGSFVLNAATALSGTGTLSIVDAVDVDLEGNDGLQGLLLHLNAGHTLTLAKPVTLSSFIDRSGTIAGAGSITVTGTTTTNLLAGDITGTGNLTIANHATLLWNNGTLGGTGTTTIAAGGTLTSQLGAKSLTRRLVNNGTLALNWGFLVVGGSITNNGAITMDGGNSINPLVIVDTTDAGVPFTNNGTIITGTGGPYEIDGYAGGTGTISIAASSVLTLRPMPGAIADQLPPSTVRAGGTLALSPSPGSPVTPGSFVLPAGKALSGAGGLLVNGAVSVALEGTNTLPALDTYQVGADHPLTIDTDLTLTLLRIESGGDALTGTGDITLTGPSTGNLYRGVFAGSGTLTIANRAELDSSGGSATMTGTGSTVVAAGGTLVFASGSIGGNRTLTNLGALNVTGAVTATGGHIINSGTLTMTGGNEFNPVGIRDPGSASVSVDNTGAIIGNTAAVAHLDGYTGGAGTITVNTGTLQIAPAVGRTAALAGGAAVSAGAVLVLAGTPTVQTGSGAFTLPTGKTITGAGQMVTDPSQGQALTVTLAGQVTIASMVNRANLVIGTSKPSPAGTFTQTHTGSLTTTLASDTAFGSVAATGTSTVDGTLVIQLAAGYTPPVGTSFPAVVGGGTLTGTFSTVDSPAGETFTPTYSASSISLRRTG